MDGGQDIGVAAGFHHRRTQTNAGAHQALHASVHPERPAIGSDRDYGFLHAVEQRLQQLAAVLDVGKALFEFARGAVQGLGDQGQLVMGAFGDARR